MRAHTLFRAAGTTALLVLIVGLLAPAGTSAHTQMLFLTGGGLVSNTAGTEAGIANDAGVQLGGRFKLSDILHVQGAVTYQNLLSAEATVHLKPFTQRRTLDPYAYVGFGTFFNGEDERSVVPVGMGIEYRLSNQLGLLFEISGRWTLNDRGTLANDLNFGIRPAIGFAYHLGQPRRARPEPPELLTDAAGSAEARAVAAAEEKTSARAELVERTAASAMPMPTRRPRQEATAMADWGVPADTVLDKRNNMVLVPDGTFILGLTDEDPLQLQTAGLRRITLSRYYIDQYEVSNADYRAYLSEMPQGQRAAFLPDTTMVQSGNRFSWSEYLRGTSFDKHPVVGVTFQQAQQYCEAHDKRLPTEAEWEYAARSGYIGGVYPWPGLEPRDDGGRFLANYNPGRGGYAADGHAFTAPVNAFPPSAWEIYNMSGNVAEWVEDSFHTSYAVLSDFNPLHVDPSQAMRMVRGGSWASDAFYIGVGVRDAQPADEASPYVGFRCVMDVSETGAAN